MLVYSEEGWEFRPHHEGGDKSYTSGTWGRVLLSGGYVPMRSEALRCPEQKINTDGNYTLYEFTYGMNGDGYYNQVKLASQNGNGTTKGWMFTGANAPGMVSSNSKVLRPGRAPHDFIMLADTRKQNRSSSTSRAGQRNMYGGAYIVYASGSSADRYWAVHNGLVNVLFPDLHCAATQQGTVRSQISESMMFFYGDEDP